MKVDFDSKLVAQTERTVRLTGLTPRVCGRCGHMTLYHISLDHRNFLDGDGREVCSLCIIELKLIKSGVIDAH